MAFNAADTEESFSSTSAAGANAPPFTISSCLRPVCRAKGGAQSAKLQNLLNQPLQQRLKYKKDNYY